MKKILLFIVSLTLEAIAVSSYTFAEPMEIEPWQNAFLNVLTEKREESPVGTIDDEGIVSYALYDIDRDGTPELFLRFGTSTAGSKCHLYRFTDGSASFVDEFYFGDIDLYSVPETSGVLLVYRNMQGKLLTLTDNGTNAIQCFKEFVEGRWEQPVSDFYPEAEYVTEFPCALDYPLLSYNTWSQPSQPTEETHYPEDNPNFFANLFVDNANVIKVRIPMTWFLPENDTETMGIRDLQESLLHNSMFGIIDTDSRSEDTGNYESYLVDLDHDGQLELLISHQIEEDDYSGRPFTMILSEQDGCVYAYVDEWYAFTDVDSKGIIYRCTNDYGIVSEYAYRVFFNAENCMKVYCALEDYSGTRSEGKE